MEAVHMPIYQLDFTCHQLILVAALIAVYVIAYFK